jgi:hypothetical protein
MNDLHSFLLDVPWEGCDCSYCSGLRAKRYREGRTVTDPGPETLTITCTHYPLLEVELTEESEDVFRLEIGTPAPYTFYFSRKQLDRLGSRIDVLMGYENDGPW